MFICGTCLRVIFKGIRINVKSTYWPSHVCLFGTHKRGSHRTDVKGQLKQALCLIRYHIIVFLSTDIQ